MFRAKLRTLVCKPPVNCSVTHKPLDNKNNGTCYDCYQFVIKRLIEIAETRINTGFFKQLDLFKLYDCCGLRDRFVGVILKVMCYYPVSVQCGKWIEQPTPEQVTKIIDTMLENHSGDVNILFTSKDVLLQFGWDCLNISIYNPDEEMCMLFEKIAASEGLFWRKS